LDGNGDYNMFDRLWRGIVNPEATARLTDKVAVENEPTWAKITRSVAEDVLAYGAVGIGKQAVSNSLSFEKQRLFAKQAMAKIEQAADDFVASKFGSADKAEALISSKDARLVGAIDDMKEGYMRATVGKLSAIEFTKSGEVTSQFQEAYKGTNLGKLLLNELDNITIKPYGLGSGLSVKIGQKVSFTEGGKDLIGTITELVGKRATIDMGGRQVVAMLSQLRVTEVVGTRAEDSSALVKEASKYKNVDEFKALGFDEILKDLRGVERDSVVEVPIKDIQIIWKDDLDNAVSMARKQDITKDTPPVEFIYDIKTGKYRLDDGHNRYVAAKRMGIPLKGVVTKIEGNLEELASIYEKEKGISIKDIFDISKFNAAKGKTPIPKKAKDKFKL